MNIGEVSNASPTGSLMLHPEHDRKIVFRPFFGVQKKELTRNVGRVYFITVDKEIVKIGGSQSKGGIKGTISLYLNGFAKGNSARTYCCWNYMHQRLKEGRNVEFWHIYAPSVTVKVPTLNTFTEMEIPVDFHILESMCVKEYFTKEGAFPFLNIQESGKKWSETGLLTGYPGITD